MLEKDYNKKFRKWKIGDTFAYKIKNNEEYKDRYLILIRYENSSWDDIDTSSPSFRVKITKDRNLPTTKEEIDKLEYIKIYLCPYCDRFLPYSGEISNEELIKERSKVKFYPDKHGRLTEYIISLHCYRKNLQELENFIYLGNFDINSPKKEYIPFCNLNCRIIILEDIEERILEFYEDYNLKKGVYYDKEYLQKCNFWGTYIVPEMDELQEMFKGRFEDEEELGDTETYVGGEDPNPWEK